MNLPANKNPRYRNIGKKANRRGDIRTRPFRIIDSWREETGASCPWVASCHSVKTPPAATSAVAHLREPHARRG